jgi:hypothetical protein
VTSDRKTIGSADADRLESFGIYQVARRLFDDFWNDSEILGRDYRGRELSKQQIRSSQTARACSTRSARRTLPLLHANGGEGRGEEARFRDTPPISLPFRTYRSWRDKEKPHHLNLCYQCANSRHSIRAEGFKRYERCNHLLPSETIAQRVSALTHIIGGLSKTIQTIENRARAKS